MSASHGQSIADRLAAARHIIDGSTVNKAVVKATTHEMGGPKRKHLDYLVTLTGAPNVNLPELANQIVERTRNTSWVVVFKALVTCHHLMCYGNERFLQSCASRTLLFSLQDFNDRSGVQGYDMSTFVRRYGRYLNEKSASYRSVAYDFTRTKRKDDTTQSFKRRELFNSMSAETLLKTLPILQQQIDALIEFGANANELTNGVINSSFVLLFKDLVRLFACYNDGIINLLQKYFEMKKQQCKDGLEIYKRYLTRMQKIQDFFKVAENVGIDKGDMPDLTSAPSSLLDALQEHLNSMEGKKSGTVSPTSPVTQTEAERVIAEERRRLDEFAKKKQTSISPPVSTGVDLFDIASPPVKPVQAVQAPQSFQAPVSFPTPQPVALAQPAQLKTPESSNKSASDDLLDLDMSGQNTLTNIMAMHNAKQQQSSSPFGQQAAFGSGYPPQQMGMAPNPFAMGGGMGVAQNPQQNPFAMNTFGGAPTQMHPPATSPFGQNPFGQHPTNNMASLNAQVQQLNMNQSTNPFGQPAQNNMMPNMNSNPFASAQSVPNQQSNRNQQFGLLD